MFLLLSWIFFGLVHFSPYGVRGTLTPSGTVAVDCGGQQTFTCDVTSITTNSAAGWTIMGLVNINAVGSNGVVTADNNPRISTSTGGNVPISTITIADFTMSDNGGTVQCINTDDSSEQGTATIAVGTLTPSGTVAVDCGGQQTFTCDVTSITTNSAAGWTIMGLVNITAVGSNGVVVANSNPRISTSTGGNVPISTITIADFTMSDNGGTVQCLNTDDSSEQGTATIAVELPSCPTSFLANRDGDFTSATVTYQLATPPPGTSTTVTYCPTSSPNCEDNMTCPSTGACTISGLNPCVQYSLTATSTNNCGSATGCTGNSMIVVSQGTPSSLDFEVEFHTDSSVLVTWEQPNPQLVTNVRVTFCTTSLSTCENTTNCNISSCYISGLTPRTGYNFILTPSNNCGTGTSSSKQFTTTQPTASPPIGTPPLELSIVVIVVPIVAAIILVVLFVLIVIVVAIWCIKKKQSMKACPCIKKKEEENGGDGDVIYDDPEKSNDNIKMQSSPAYQTVSAVCGSKDGYDYSGMTDDVKMEPSPAYQTVS